MSALNEERMSASGISEWRSAKKEVAARGHLSQALVHLELAALLLPGEAAQVLVRVKTAARSLHDVMPDYGKIRDGKTVINEMISAKIKAREESTNG